MKIFYCYSKQLCLFLKLQDIDYIAKEINPKSNTPYWTFVRNEKLCKGLTDWEKYKKTFYKEELRNGTNSETKNVRREIRGKRL